MICNKVCQNGKSCLFFIQKNNKSILLLVLYRHKVLNNTVNIFINLFEGIMENKDVAKFKFSEIKQLGGEDVGRLLIWFNKTDFQTIKETISTPKDIHFFLKIIELPWYEIPIDFKKLEQLRNYVESLNLSQEELYNE